MSQYPCTKVAYISERQAKHAARLVSKSVGRLAAYFCDRCHRWHIAHADERPWVSKVKGRH